MKHKRMTIIVLATLCMVMGWGMMTVWAAEKSFPKIHLKLCLKQCTAGQVS